MYKYSFTVRGYNVGRRYGLPHYSEWQARANEMPALCLAIGDSILRHKKGLKTAAEMYRAAGLGVYEIFNRLEGQISLERLKALCSDLDYELHWALD